MIRASGASLLFAACLALAFPGCESHSVPADAGPSEPSPNASILPAPLATGPDTSHPATDAGATDAGPDAEAPPPVAAREDEALSRDTEELRDASGVTLRARFRWPDVTPPPRLPEANADALDRTRNAATFDLDITAAAAGRLNVTLASPRFVLPAGSAFRARSSSYGHLLVWPDGGRYVVVQMGALRTLLNERRADVVPLAHVAGAPRGSGQAVGFPTERTLFVAALGRLEVEQARVAAAGQGGALLCRFLLELVGVHPDSESCRPELVPVRAEYVWTDGGRLTFEALSLERSSSLELSSLRTPPLTAEHRIGEVPTPPPALLVERAQLRGIRLRAAPARRAKDAPKDGLLLANGDDLLRFALVDGVPVARLEPKNPGLLLDLLAGTYSLSARTFLGDELTPPTIVTVPGRFVSTDSTHLEP